MSDLLTLPLKVNANARGHSRFQPTVKLGSLERMTYRQATVTIFRPHWLRFAGRDVDQQELLAGGLVVKLTRVAPRELDGHDNLRTAFKPIVDGVTDALGLPNDRDPRVSWAYGQRRGAAREHLVEIELSKRSAVVVCPACGLPPMENR